MILIAPLCNCPPVAAGHCKDQPRRSTFRRAVVALLMGIVPLIGPQPASPQGIQLSDARLHGGYFTEIEDHNEIIDIRKTFQTKLLDMGIKAMVSNCEHAGMVAEGFVGSAYAYGAQCQVKIGSKAPRRYWLCNNDMAGFYLADAASESIASTEEFIRRTCW